jgi:pimeloyl-ACP methyl ester carboxylesterase
MRRFVGAAVVAILVSLTMVTLPFGAMAATDDGKPSGKGIVYLIRGGLNIFSTGMDEIAEALRAEGVDARTLGQATWRNAAREAAERYREAREPVVFVGHSFGANAAILAAEHLGDSRIPVTLIVLFDPTEALKAPHNVKRLVNFLSLDSTGMDFNVWTTPGFSGQIETVVDRDVNHIQIDNDPGLQQRTVDEVLKALRMGARASAR